MIRKFNVARKRPYSKWSYPRKFKKKVGTKFSRSVVGIGRYLRHPRKSAYSRARLALRYGMRRWRSARNRNRAVGIRAGRARAMQNYARAVAVRLARARSRAWRR